MLKADRWCARCEGPRPWVARYPAPGARARRRECVMCGSPTTRIKGRPKRSTMPRGLYEHRSLTKTADALWTAAIHAKAMNGCCARCGRHRPLQAAHNVCRRIGATRHDISNGAPLCAGCHRLVDSDAEEKRAFFLGYIGLEEYDRLQLRKRAGGKMDLRLVILHLADRGER